MRTICTALLLSSILIVPTASAQDSCSNSQRSKLSKLQDTYISTIRLAQKTGGYEPLAGQDGVVHSKSYCKAVEHHIRDAQNVVNFVNSAGCFSPSELSTAQKDLDEAVSERSGCRASAKRVYTEDDHRRARAGVNAFQLCVSSKESQGISTGKALNDCTYEVIGRGNY